MPDQSRGYDHVQRGPLYVLILIPSLIAFAVASPTDDPQIRTLLFAVGVITLFLAACFANLRVRDGGDALEVVYGPLPLFKKRFRYDEMLSAEAARSDFLDGWGIHWIVGRGWIYNLWGYDCVAVQRADGKRLRVGTDDPKGLTSFLVQRIAQAGSGARRT